MTESPRKEPRGDREVILTPDQRVRVFISSTLEELAAERAAARRAIRRLHLAPVWYESGARPHPPRRIYRAYLEQSQVFVGIYWQRYGWVAPGMDISGLEDEYRLAADKPMLLYLKRPAPDEEPRMTAFVDRIREVGTMSYRTFATPRELERLLAEDLAVLLSESFYDAALLHNDPSLAVPDTVCGAQTDQLNVPVPEAAAMSAMAEASRSNMPAPVASFVGREAELSELDKLAGRHRLVTITGTGGVGKTRLAIALATSKTDEYRDGVWFVDLAELVDPARVPEVVADAVGLRQTPGQPVEQLLISRITSMKALLVFDNCEHLVESVAAMVERILEAGVGVRVIATSRQALGVPGETVWDTPPIAFPRGQQFRDSAELASFDAVRLFMERVPHLRGSVSARDLRIIAAITADLEGLPLAIELAAARAAQFGVQQLAGILHDRLGLSLLRSRTAHSRQQTLDATIGWSFDLLTPELRSALKRLSVFSGGFTVEAADAIIGASGSVIEMVASLGERSLIMVDGELWTGQTGRAPLRYRMLETIRQYCAARIAAEDGSNGDAAIRERHSQYFADLARQASGALTDRHQGKWLSTLDTEHANLVAALTYLLAQPSRAGDALQMTVHLERFWRYRGYLGECATLLRRGLEMGGQNVSPAVRSGALSLAGQAANSYDSSAARLYLTESLEIARNAHDAEGVARALRGLAGTAYCTGDLEEGLAFGREAVDLARSIGNLVLLGECLLTFASNGPDHQTCTPIYEEVLAVTRRSGDRIYAAWAHNDLGNWALVEDDLEAARYHLEQAQAISREIGVPDPIVESNLGLVHLRQGQLDAAQAAFTEALLIAELHHVRRDAAVAILGLACTATAQRDWERAACMFGFADRERQDSWKSWPEPERTYREQWICGVERQLGAGYERLYEMADTADRNDLIDFALGRQHLPVAEW